MKEPEMELQRPFATRCIALPITINGFGTKMGQK